uniref:HPt domain-containing protein n=1 Tax=Guillardia theta TaxID=55529 RepID=A0A7S4UES6_GUITH|mmetsp:Transcript_979/g.3099  ORF Transcript_979/g.3099 Transcript_979/m.3099 type:complete len:226 (+) Transcript_979:67-744(+)
MSPVEVDLATALERCSGSMELLNQVVSETLTKAEAEQMPMIRKAVSEGDSQTAHFHAHSIKGASATIGFDSLSKAAKALDDLVRTGSTENAQELVDNMEESLKVCLEYWQDHESAMNSALERCSDDQELFLEIAKEMAKDVVPEQLQALESALADNDVGGVQTSAQQLKDASETIGASVLMKLLGRLLELCDKGETGGMAEIVEEMKGEVAKVSAFWECAELSDD